VKFQEIGQGVVKRKEKRVLGLFIDGTGLDRATRRISRKVDLSSLVRGVTSGTVPVVARYYTLIPYEDDSRQRAFLEAVCRAGLEVIVKRLPPKGITRQVSVDVEMTADIVAFALGHQRFSDLGKYQPGMLDSQEGGHRGGGAIPTAMPFLRAKHLAVRNPHARDGESNPEESASAAAVDVHAAEPSANGAKEKRIMTVVCPSRELAYPVSLAKDLGIDTITADFGQFNSGDILKSAAKWIDLSDSETIWRE
jgi:hypothetical protein